VHGRNSTHKNKDKNKDGMYHVITFAGERALDILWDQTSDLTWALIYLHLTPERKYSLGFPSIEASSPENSPFRLPDGLNYILCADCKAPHFCR
jgi:hypothetical protein